jgi:hypothetical protein
VGPEGPREQIQRAIQSTGCQLRADPERGGYYQADCPSYQARAKIVDLLAWKDALYDGNVHELAHAITADLPTLDPESVARRVHQVIRDQIRYAGEAGDMIQHPIQTWNQRAGDCDCHARLVLALLRSLGVDCDFCGFENDEKTDAPGGPFVDHAVAMWRRNPGDFVFMETTVPGAEFGEHPQAAFRRLFTQQPEPPAGFWRRMRRGMGRLFR